MLARNGCSASNIIVLSKKVLSTYSVSSNTSFLIALIAYNLPVSSNSAKYTRPNAPFPSVLLIVKLYKVRSVGSFDLINSDDSLKSSNP